MPVAAPADKRFRRARVSPGRKRRWRPSWRTLATYVTALTLAALALWKGVEAVLSSPALTVTEIRVQGNERVSAGEVTALLDGLRGQSLVTADLEGWRRKLLASPWVADATVRRVLPGGVMVTVTERRPMGIARLPGGLFLVDGAGTVIDGYGPNYAEFNLPIVDGLAGASAGAIDEGRARLAGRVIADLERRAGLAGRLSEVDVSDPRDAVVLLEGDTTFVHLGSEAFSARVESYLDLAPALRAEVPDMDYVDLRFGERVYVGPLNRGRDDQGRRGPAGRD